MLIKKFINRLCGPDDGDGSELSGGDAVGTGNDARVAMLERINDINDQTRAEELANVNDDGSTEEYVAPNLTPSDDDGVTQQELDRAEAEANPEPEAPAAPQMITRKINGREVTLPLDEWLSRASKVEAADQYLGEAARLRQQAAQQNLPPTPTAPSQADVRARQIEERRALVRAIQMGSEEEAMAALEQLQTMSQRPQLSAADLARTVDERLTFKEAVGRFEKDYQDILGDPQLRTLALQRDQELLNAGDKRDYWERYSEIGENLRSWRNGLVKQAQPDPLANKQTAKADAAKRSAPKPASTKASSAMTADEAEESVSDVITAIAKARGGPQWARA